MRTWNKSSDCCSWGAVKCDAKSGKVISLNLNNVPLNNTLKPNIGLFKLLYLQNLSLSNCYLYGEILSSFGNLSHLTKLDLSYNELVGQVPSSFGNMTKLRYLLLDQNKLSGKFSVSFANLKVIDVSHNDFTGAFPAFYFSNWFQMSQMTTLNPIYGIYMEYRFMYAYQYGTYSSSMELMHKGVDTEFDKIRKDFTSIDFSRNKFSGKIPESIGLLKGLRFLNLSSNAFTSNIPQSLANLTNFEVLDLSQNQLSGPIPRDLGELSFLSTMNFAHNNLEGPIPQNWTYLHFI